MQDFPVLCNGGQSASEAWHAEKMLKDLSPELGPPVVRADRELFFIHELLQLRDKSYFVPTRYYRDGKDSNLYAIGWRASQTEVSKMLDGSGRVAKLNIHLGRVYCA